jgi:hypothetical protein
VQVQLFGFGLKGKSPAIDAQRRINCYVEQQKDNQRTQMAIIGSPGLSPFCLTIGASPSRGMWPVNTLPTPLTFTVHSGTLFSVNNAGVATSIGMIGTTTGDVSMVDNGTYLVLVDGVRGYYYNMLVPAGLNQIVDANFTTSPKTVTWQDTYFIVNSGATNQFQLSSNSDPTTWPAVNINFTGSAAGAIQALIADHSILQIFGDVYSEFFQDAGTPDFPYAGIPGSAQEFGLASAWSLCKYDNSLAGLFKNRMGEVNISRMAGFKLQQLSNLELDFIINAYSTVSDAQAFGYMLGGHPLYLINFPTAMKSWEFDQASQVWGERQATDGSRYWGQKFAAFQNRKLVSDYRSGNIYQIDPTVYTDNGSAIPMEVWSKRIWNADKYIGISVIQIDFETGVGVVSGQGSNPQVDLQVSKDGGNTFTSVGFSSIGAIGQYTQRVIWRSLGAARDWILKLRITDPVKRVIVGATAEMEGGPF